MTILVTGATGLVGNNVVRLLLDRGEQVRVLVRVNSDPRPLDGLDVERVVGDVRDAESVAQACRGAGAIIHAAGYVRYGWSEAKNHEEINVGGACHVADAAKAAGVRLAYVSTADTVAVATNHQPVAEDTPGGDPVPCPYVLSKRQAEHEVLRRASEGLDVVVVNPTFMLGPWDWKPSSGKILLAAARCWSPLAPSGAKNFCDVRDVAAGAFAALQHGTAGRRYLLGGENLEFIDAWRLFCDVTGQHRPWLRSGPLLSEAGGRLGDFWGRLTGNEPDLNSAAVAASRQCHWYDSSRAIQELGYQIRPLRKTVEDAWAWFREYGYA